MTKMTNIIERAVALVAQGYYLEDSTHALGGGEYSVEIHAIMTDYISDDSNIVEEKDRQLVAEFVGCNHTQCEGDCDASRDPHLLKQQVYRAIYPVK